MANPVGQQLVQQHRGQPDHRGEQQGCVGGATAGTALTRRAQHDPDGQQHPAITKTAGPTS